MFPLGFAVPLGEFYLSGYQPLRGASTFRLYAEVMSHFYSGISFALSRAASVRKDLAAGRAFLVLSWQTDWRPISPRKLFHLVISSWGLLED